MAWGAGKRRIDYELMMGGLEEEHDGDTPSFPSQSMLALDMSDD